MGHALLCDIGNTQLKIGFAVRGEVRRVCRLPVHAQTVDSLGLALLELARLNGPETGNFGCCLAASVVPALDVILKDAVKKYLGCDTLFLGRDLVAPLENKYERPHEVGADRLAAAYGARVLSPLSPSLIVADFGTAVTFDCVSGNAYLGGMIFPGPSAAMAALSEKTARLPPIAFDCALAEPVPGRTTEAGLRNGLIYGYAELTAGLCNLLARQLPGPVGVIAAGGFALVVSSVCDIFDCVRPELVLDGLAAVYRKYSANKRS